MAAAGRVYTQRRPWLRPRASSRFCRRHRAAAHLTQHRRSRRNTGVAMRTAVVAIFAVAMVLGAQAQYQPCGKGEACPEGECCMLTGNRYGLPSCQPLRTSGAACRPNAQPQNFTLSPGPFTAPSHYTGVYWAVCPCQSGLKCNDEGACA